MKAIVGYDGFVGSNIVRKVKFDQLYNKANIEESYGSEPDLLIYAGVPAEVYYANKYPEKDLEIVNNAINNIFIIGSENVSNNNFKKVSCFFLVNIFSPYFSLLIITSSSLRPLLFIIIPP